MIGVLGYDSGAVAAEGNTYVFNNPPYFESWVSIIKETCRVRLTLVGGRLLAESDHDFVTHYRHERHDQSWATG